MKRLLISSAALALCLGTGAAMAQTETHETTRTVTSPSGETTETHTKTTTTDDGYAKYKRTVTSTKHYDAGPFQAPAGYTYSRYAVGDRIPVKLYGASDLVIDSYGNYHLATPPQGLEWVRVGDDALLVDRSNGEVIQADYGLFASQ